MKFLLIFSLCCLLAAASKPKSHNHDSFQEQGPGGNVLINELIKLLIDYIRHVINNGSILFGIPRLDPLELDEYHLQVPIGLFNFDLQLKNSVMNGIGGFVVHKSELTVPDLTFEIDVSIPRIDISTELYDITGDFSAAFPLYGIIGKAKFVIEGFRFQAKLYLRQSDNEKSVIIDKIEGASFEVPLFESKIDGGVGGGDIDQKINAIVEDVVIGYINRFSGVLTKLGTTAFINSVNPILEQRDTWRFIAPFV